jgi:hypothetical protein
MKKICLLILITAFSSCFDEPKKDKLDIEKKEFKDKKITPENKNSKLEFLESLDGKYPYEVKLYNSP